MKTERNVLSNTLHTTIMGTGRVQGEQTGNWSGLHAPALGSAIATAWDQILSLKEYWSDSGHSCSYILQKIALFEM